MEIITDIARNVQPCAATIGFFDGVHCGHRFLIEQVKQSAQAQGLKSGLITFPVHPRKVMQKGYQPELLSTPEEKLELLSATGVDYCFVLEFTKDLSCLSAREFMEQIVRNRLNVRSLIIGYDHRFGHNRQEGFEDYCRYGKELGMEVILAHACISAGTGVSSSVVRQLLHKGEVDKAATCLGYEYALQGKVVDGHKVGRTLGFPTANLYIENPDKLIPADGVYAVKVAFEGKEYMGMLDIGHRPTLDNGANKSIEVHILDFSDDIYGQSVYITFVRRIRSDIKFQCIDDLKAQLHQDEVKIRELLMH